MSENNSIENVIIIGWWPAWHTAAIYAARARLEPLMFEWFMAGGLPAGGQLMTTTEVENFPWFPDGITGPDLMHHMREQSKKNGTRIEAKTVDSVDLSSHPFTVTVGKNTYQTKTLIISTGATAKKLDVPGVEEYRNKGISGCAVCDGALPIFRDKHLAVIWWGDVALEEAMHLAKYGSKVSVFVRRNVLRASKVMQDRALSNPKIEFHRFTELKEVHGDKIISWLTVTNNQTGEEQKVDVWGLFFAIGHTPNTWFLDGQLETDDTWYIITTPWTASTMVPWVYAAGDVQDKKYRQAVTSAGVGCMAALEAEHFLQSLDDK